MRRNASKTSWATILATFLAANFSYATETHVGTTTTYGDPTQIVRQAITPLFMKKRGADKNETQYFSQSLKSAADDYFSTADNARDFDADWLLGMQDWSEMTPSFSIFVIDERRAKVKVDFTSAKKDDKEDDKRSISTSNLYTIILDDRLGWRIDDIDYSNQITLREMIAHNGWCHHVFRKLADFSECNVTAWK